jgi:hypothetical protein
MRVRASVAALLLALLAGSGSTAARAASTPPAVVVASDGDTELVAGDETNDLCVGVRTRADTSKSCEMFGRGVVDLGGPQDGARYAAVGVAASAATVEVRRAGQLVVSGSTVAGEAYKGKRAGQVRFALLRLPDNTREDGLRVRGLDAAGALVTVLAPDADSELVLARGRLLSGRSGRLRWSIDANQASELEPTVVDLGHERVSACAVTRIHSGGATAKSSGCVGPTPFENLEIFNGELTANTDELCSPEFRLLHGVAEAGSVTVLLGDGRKRIARTAAFGDGRRIVYALVIPHDVAVRSITFAGGAAGSRVLAVGLAPLHVLCPNIDEETNLLDGPDGAEELASLIAHPPPLTLPGPVTTLAGSGTRVTDGPGDTLCLAVANQPFSAFGCQIVAPTFDDLAGTVDDFTDPRAFVLALPARVAAIRIGAPGGPLIPTVPGAGYAGAYAGHVRFAAGTATAASQLDSLDLLDGAGAVLHRERTTPDRVGSGGTGVTDRRRIAGRPGRPSLWQTSYRGPYRCVALTTGPRPATGTACQNFRSRSTVLLAVSCATHRLTVAVTPGAGARVLANTGASRPRAIPLRHGAGLLTLPASRPLRSLTYVRRGRSTTVRISAPAGARQCGWSAAPHVKTG